MQGGLLLHLLATGFSFRCAIEDPMTWALMRSPASSEQRLKVGLAPYSIRTKGVVNYFL